MNTAAKNAALMDQSIEPTKRMMAVDVRLLWLEYLQLLAYNLRVMDGQVKPNE
jgi:hypothetical protein